MNLNGLGEPARLDLVTEAGEDLGIRTDPRNPRGLNGGGKLGDLGEETVSGMDGIGTGAHCHIEQLLNVHIRFSV